MTSKFDELYESIINETTNDPELQEDAEKAEDEIKECDKTEDAEKAEDEIKECDKTEDVEKSEEEEKDKEENE